MIASNIDNRKNVLKLGEGPIDNIKSSAGTAEKSFVLILVKQNQNFAWVCIIMVITVYLLMEKKSNFKADDKNLNFPTQFCLRKSLCWVRRSII